MFQSVRVTPFMHPPIFLMSQLSEPYCRVSLQNASSSLKRFDRYMYIV